MTAYVSIRPDHDIRLRVVCQPCDGVAPFAKYRDAVAAARLHNQTEHQKETP